MDFKEVRDLAASIRAAEVARVTAGGEQRLALRGGLLQDLVLGLLLARSVGLQVLLAQSPARGDLLIGVLADDPGVFISAPCANWAAQVRSSPGLGRDLIVFASIVVVVFGLSRLSSPCCAVTSTVWLVVVI